MTDDTTADLASALNARPEPTAPPELFDILDALRDRAYPEIEVPFYMDEAAALSLAEANEELTRLALLGKTEEHDALESTIKDLQIALQGSRYVYHLRGLPNKIRQDLLEDAYSQFPRNQNNQMAAALGIEDENDERDRYFSAHLLQAMTVKIISPKGAVQVNPPIETIEFFQSYAPLAALEVINKGINKLTDGPKAGFEAAAQDTDFLSQR